jgi:hypothetical protein
MQGRKVGTMPESRFETLEEVDRRLALEKRYANADYGKSAYPERPPWWQRSVPIGWFLAAIVLGVLGVLFAIGLTLHEAYDAQTAMGAHLSPPPFNGLFETIHGWLASSPNKYIW